MQGDRFQIRDCVYVCVCVYYVFHYDAGDNLREKMMASKYK
jgi:hypothetical protein